MYKNPLVAFLLGFIPGAGHLYLGRKVRALVYPLLFFGSLALGAFASIMSHDGDPFVVMGIAAAIIWGVNMLDIVISAIAYGRRPAMDMTAAVPYPDGSVPMPPYPHSQPPQVRDSDERFRTILLSFIPGLGHFQLGLMNRGLTLLIGFFGSMTMILFVSFLANQDGFLVFFGALPIIWLYGMFDAIRMVTRKQQGETLIDRTILEDIDEHRESGRRSKVIATLLAIFPGAGHMYLGLQKRGLQLMAAFLFSIYILDVLRLSLFLFFVPILWFYSFFDALQQVTRYSEGKEEMKDVPIVDWLVNQQKWIGVGLLLLGGFYLVDQFVLEMLDRMFPDRNIGYWLRSYLQTFIVSAMLIGGGLKLAFGKKIRKEE